MAEITSKDEPQADSIKDLNTNSAEIRQQLVETAAKFLQNPKVRKSPLLEKKAFLAGKGLTTAEIDASIGMVGFLTEEQDPRNRNIYSSENVQPYISYPMEFSRLSLIRDYCATILFIGGAAYGFYHLIKKYLMPYLTGVPSHEDRIAKLESQMNGFHSTLNETMSQLRDMIAELQITLQQVNKKSEATATPPLDNNILENQFGELHSEMKSLKGLLLNRHQFPATPYITPIIPTWQLTSDEPVVESKTTPNCDDGIVTEVDDEIVEKSPFTAT